jgi:hypothetical protein
MSRFGQVQHTAVTASINHGRIRLRLSRSARNLALTESIQTSLGQIEGVTKISVSTLSGSVLIEHDPANSPTSQVSESLKNLGISVTPHKPQRALSKPPLPPVSLKTLGPVVLGILAIRQFHNGPKLRDAPWYVTAWYALSLFDRFNSPSQTA